MMLVYKYVLPWLLEGKVLGWLNGKKTNIGRIVQMLSAISLAVDQAYPGHSVVTSTNSILAMLTGYFVTEVGMQHKVSKEIRGL